MCFIVCISSCAHVCIGEYCMYVCVCRTLANVIVWLQLIHWSSANQSDNLMCGNVFYRAETCR